MDLLGGVSVFATPTSRVSFSISQMSQLQDFVPDPLNDIFFWISLRYRNSVEMHSCLRMAVDGGMLSPAAYDITGESHHEQIEDLSCHCSSAPS